MAPGGFDLRSAIGRDNKDVFNLDKSSLRRDKIYAERMNERVVPGGLSHRSGWYDPELQSARKIPGLHLQVCREGSSGK